MLQDLAGYVLFAIQVGVLLVGLYAFVHAAIQRTDAYHRRREADQADLAGDPRRHRPGRASSCRRRVGSAIAACAVGVYLVDVRPKILEVQGKSR